MSVREWSSGEWFSYVHGNHLVYNCCWEDPRLDREALNLGHDDTLLMITSAGCNALDYALLGPKRIHAVDMNYRQNALLELKLAGIRSLDYETFFQMFGKGRLDNAIRVYGQRLRRHLSPQAQRYWDKHLHYFDGDGGRAESFYFYGTSGYFAWLVNCYINRRPRLRDGIDAILSASSLDEQQDVYYNHLEDAFWNRFIRWAVGRDAALALLGVPTAQRRQVELHYGGGIAQFMEECIESVFACLPLGDNYFWRVYLTGQYTETCCPEYLKRENFNALREGLADCIEVHTETVEGFLRHTDERISRYVLLDHMDWLSTHRMDALHSEWQAIVDRAAPSAKILWRSGGMRVDYVDPIEVRLNGSRVRMGEVLRYDEALATRLHALDRVHTYGSFYVADYAAS